MEKKHRIELTQDEYDLLLMGLRYLELNFNGEAFDPKDNMKAEKRNRTDFMKLLNNINSQVTQTTLFKE